MTTFTINVIADVVCPFCYAASKQVAKGIAAYKQKYPGTTDTFDVKWEPFQLDPTAPEKGIDFEEYVTAKMGPGMVPKIEEAQAGIGRENGIAFKKGAKTGSTKDSHRLIYLAGQKSPETQSKIVNELYAGYFEKAQDITSKDFLITSAVAAGIDKKEATEFLKSGQGEEYVESKVAKARAAGVRSVPNITVGDDYPVGQKRDPESFVKLFETIKSAAT